MWQIGNVEIKNRVVMAPMAGISNIAYRLIIKEMGAGLIFTEMVSDRAIIHQNEKTLKMLVISNKERPIVLQIFGNNPLTMAQAAKYIYENIKPDIIDINMGCPVPKVAQKGQAGCALMQDEKKAYEIVKAVVNSVPIPITVKIRSGYDKINAVAIAQICEKAGAKAISVHPRTRAQGYRGKADWQIIKDVKANVSIPVIGNGDIKSCYDAQKMLDETNCDAVMIGRGLLGNPWLIKECIDYLEKAKIPDEITLNEKIKMMEKHYENLLYYKNEKVATLEMRQFALWYLKGIPCKELKKAIVEMKNKTDFTKIIKKCQELI